MTTTPPLVNTKQNCRARAALGNISGNREKRATALQPIKPTHCDTAKHELKDASGGVRKRSNKRLSRSPPLCTVRRKKQTAPYRIQVSSCIAANRTSAESLPAYSRPSKPSGIEASTGDGHPILQTDPSRTRALWDRIMDNKGPARDTKASKTRRFATLSERPSRAQGLQTRGGRGNVERTTDTSTISSRIASSNRTSHAKPTDPDFRTNILEPKGISIVLKSPSMSAFAQFNTNAPTNGYQELQGCGDTSVWLDMDDHFAHGVMREYLYMEHCRLVEAEFATYAKETLLRRDPRSLELSLSRARTTERMVEAIAKPDMGLLWEEPPPTSPGSPGKPYGFDIRPDCSYWLPIQAFNPVYKSQVKEWVYVKDKRYACPYFTVEFKRDDLSVATAINQVATASALALYNRVLLKHERLKAPGKQWTERHLQQLRHYGLTFYGASYDFWCIIPKMDMSNEWSWTGCEMVRVYQNSCTDMAGVKHFIDWVNEIHRWGLTVHGPSCERDVKHCIERNSKGINTSLIEGEDSSLNEEDGAEGIV